jgi:urease accessory protein
MHISKPVPAEGRTLVVNIVNPTAGLLAGDRVEVGVQVETGARLLLTTPSANRLHRMAAGCAYVKQEFQVSKGAWLEHWPEFFIPQGGGRYSAAKRPFASTRPAELLFLESLAPGRVASGEAFAYERLEFETDLFWGETARCPWSEIFSEPDAHGVAALRARFPTAYYASCFIITPRLRDTRHAGNACMLCMMRTHGSVAAG